MWERGESLKHYRPIKTAASVRIDNDVLDRLKSKGEGYLKRINRILRERDDGGIGARVELLNLFVRGASGQVSDYGQADLLFLSGFDEQVDPAKYDGNFQ